MRYLLLFVSCIMLQSCYTEKKANRQVVRAQAIYPEVVANGCAAWYPPGVFEKITTEYKPGFPIIYRDTVYVNCDSILKHSPAGVNNSNVKVPCPPCKERVDTVFRTREVQVENTSKVAALEANVTKLTADAGKSEEREKQTKEDLEIMTKSRNLGWIIAGGLAVLIGISMVIRLKNKAA